MKALPLSVLFATAAATVKLPRQSTPQGCRALSGDAEFPAADVWTSALPGILPRHIAAGGPARPDYRFTARSAGDVEQAVQFAAQHNVRLTVINTGHDYQGRNDAPSGLSLDTSQLRGVRISPSFTPTPQGAQSPVDGEPVNNITLVPGQQPAVTFGVGIVGSEVNLAINDSKIFVVAGASPTVSIAGGWGQTAGHSFISNQYGLGADQFLEFKVVTADGRLKVANNVSNPDLFWALRGGGGGNFGVVTEATMKAYPQVPVAAYVFSISSSTASPLGLLGLGDENDGLYDAIAYMSSQLPDIMDDGMSGGFIPTIVGYAGYGLFLNENATEQHVKSVWDPVLDQMQTYPGMEQWKATTFVYPSFQDFYEAVWPMVGITTGGSGTGGGEGIFNLMSQVANISLGNLPQALFGGTNNRLLERYGRPSTGDWVEPLLPRYTSDGDYDPPTAGGKFAMDTWLLDRNALKSLPSQNMSTKRSYGSTFIIEAVAGNKVQRPDEDVSVLPAWRRAYVQADTVYMPPLITADILQQLAPDMGAYANEAYYDQPNWKQVFWGSNYDRLSQIKTQYDPNMVFWNTPGINADMMEVQDGRVCSAANPSDGPGNTPPATDNPNMIDVSANLAGLLGIGVPETTG